jgi:CRP/FNR family transcriptional regulator, nitrogen fixation regulation protein
MTLTYPFEDSRAAVQSQSLGEAMDRLGVRMTFAKDEEVYAQEEDADLIYRVVSGVVRTTRLLSDGRRQVGDFYEAGELFGLEVGAQHRYSAEALCDCTIQVVKRSALRAQAAEGELDRAIWEGTCRDLERAQDHVLLLGRKTAAEKVASFLMELAQRGDDEAVDLPMGRQDIADYLGLTIETVSRMLTQLQSSKVVEFASCRQFRVRKWEVLERLAA